MNKRVVIYDTSLRDGTQGEGVSLSCEDKLRIAQQLDDIGVGYIEGGWPGSNPKDVEFFRRTGELTLKNAKIASFGSTCRIRSKPADDENIRALLDSGTPVCTIFGKTWKLHVHEVLKTTPEENLRIIHDSVEYLHSQGREVIYDAEHFFDGYKDDPEYALKTLEMALTAGAQTIVLCETNGGTLPDEVRQIVIDVRSRFPDAILGIHTHNDGECAVANSLVAINEGATHVQGTINGIGERCGNANLCSIIPSLELKMGISCLPEGNLKRLSHLSRFLTEIANLKQNEYQPYVGRSAFAHKGGVHVAAMRRSPRSYQHIEPEWVGNESRSVVSELSGRGNLLSLIDQFGLKIDNQDAVTKVLQEVKDMEASGFSYEAAEASVALMIYRHQTGYQPPFELIDFSAIVEHREGRGMFSEATVKVNVKGNVYHTAADGNGPVNALDAALRKALIPVYPKLEKFQLVDYKVRILDGYVGSAATTRVLIDTHDGEKVWSTVGAGTNIIEASWKALYDSYEYGLLLA
ncbi:MAG: citramalate synthase [Chloroflexota bacterium]